MRLVKGFTQESLNYAKIRTGDRREKIYLAKEDHVVGSGELDIGIHGSHCLDS